RNNPKDSGSLASNYINGLYEDRKGNLWIGTDGGGLNLYNRNTNSFIHYLHNDADSSSIKDNSVRSIYEDTQGNLWVGTYRGVDKMVLKTGKFIHYAIVSKTSDAALTEQVSCITQDSQ